MSEHKKPLKLWKLWPVLGFGLFIAWEALEASQQGRPIDMTWVGICVAGIVAVLIIRVGMRV